MSLWFTSDMHFDHDREFIYKPRGFENVQEQNEVILENILNSVKEDDELYLLGDIALGGPDNDGTRYLKEIPCKIHIIRGNHDTDKRIEAYAGLPNVVDIVEAMRLNVGKYHFFLCHYPTYTSSLTETSIKRCLINLYGHTHQKSNFFNDIPFMYHVGVDSHNNKPICLEEIIEDIKKKKDECFAMV